MLKRIAIAQQLFHQHPGVGPLTVAAVSDSTERYFPDLF